ncbi:MAG: hypothetical protein E7184_02370 [Erysipelotrichaceae bacterium]|nr:hypothetical protein [Erysipelotrichaceae bacterium]
MKVKKLLKVASVAVLASTLAACGKEKVSKKDYEKWAKDNGYVLESDYEGWVENPDYEGWAEDNGYVQIPEEIDYTVTPTLEVAFGETYSTVSSKDLNSKLGYKQNVALIIGGSTCTGCSTLKSEGILDEFVETTGYKLYYWQYDTDANWTAYLAKKAKFDANDGTYANAEAFENDIKNNAAVKIIREVYGGLDEIIATPTLVAYVNPQNDTVSRSAVENLWSIDGNTAAQIKAKLETVYTFETEEFAAFREVAELSQIKTAGDMVKEVASGDASIMFFSRYGCGSCQVLQNTSTNWNFITRLFKDIEVEDGKDFKFIALVSEDIQNSIVGENNLTFYNGVKAVYDRAVANEDLSDEAKITWFKTTNVQYVGGQWKSAAGAELAFSGDRYNELVMYAVALGQVKVTADMVTSQGYLTEAFWTAVETWVDSDAAALQEALGTQVIDTSKGSEKLYQGERLIPAFLAVNYQEWSNKWVVTKPSSNDQNAPINNFYDLPRELGVKTTGAVGYADFVEYLYQRTLMYIETWVNYGSVMTQPAA